MATVTIVNPDTYHVCNFVQSMPHLEATIAFSQNEPRVVNRTGYTLDAQWDRTAIQAVQFALLANTVTQPNRQI